MIQSHGLRIAVAAALFVVMAGCDSNDNELDSLAGTWSVTAINVGGQDFLPTLQALAGVSGLGATFGQNGTFSVFLQTSEGPAETAGTYSFDPQTNVLVMESESFAAPLELDYSLSGNALELSSEDASVLAELSGIELPIPIQGSVLIRFSRQ